MPKATKKNMMLDRTSNHGGWPEGEYEPGVTDQLFDWYFDMKRRRVVYP